MDKFRVKIVTKINNIIDSTINTILDKDLTKDRFVEIAENLNKYRYARIKMCTEAKNTFDLVSCLNEVKLGMDIILLNSDGFEAPTLEVLQKALTELEEAE